MCARYEFTGYIGNEFDFVEWPEIQPGLDMRPGLEVRPTNPAPVVLSTGNKQYQIQLRRWAFIKSWPDKTGKVTKKTLFNAKSEVITTTRSFKKAFATSRCVIPMNAWIEWPEIPEINNGKKTLTRIFMPSRPTFGVAGIYEDDIDKETGEVTARFSMLTTKPGENSPIKNIHARSPLILDAPDYDLWMTGTAEEVLSLMHPYPDTKAFAFTF